MFCFTVVKNHVSVTLSLVQGLVNWGGCIVGVIVTAAVSGLVLTLVIKILSIPDA